MIDVNAAIADKAIRVLESFGVSYPGRGNDADAMRAQAERYRAHAEAVRQSYGQAGSCLNNIDWAGSTADAHSQLAQYHIQLANDVADHMDTAAGHLETHAGKAETIIRTIIGTALEILEALLATAVLSWLAGWVAQLIFLHRTARLISRAAKLCQAFRRLVDSAVEVMRGVGNTAGKIAEYTGQIFTKWLPEYLVDSVTMYTGNMAPEFLSGRGLGNARNVFLYSLLPFEALDFAGYFAIHVLEQETKIGRRVKNAVDNYGKRDESAARDTNPARSPSRDDLENASVRSPAEVNPRSNPRTENIELATFRDGASLRSAGRGEDAGRGVAAKEEAPQGAVDEPDLNALVRQITDLTLVAPEADGAARWGAGHGPESKAVLEDPAAVSPARGDEAVLEREPVVKQGAATTEGSVVKDASVVKKAGVAGQETVVKEPEVNALVRQITDLTLVTPEAEGAARSGAEDGPGGKLVRDERAGASPAVSDRASSAREGVAVDESDVDAVAVSQGNDDGSVRIAETEEVAVGRSGYVAPTKAQVLYGVAKEFLVTGAGNTVLNLANGDTKPGHIAWGILGGGSFAAADKGVRNRYGVPYVMSKKPEGVPDGLWLWTVGEIVKAGIRSGRFTLKTPFTDLVVGADIDTQLGSTPTL